MNNNKIKRVSYKKRDNKLIPNEKVIIEKLDEDCYRTIKYSWSTTESKWKIAYSYGYFDGEKLNECGLVTITHNNIDRLFELLVKKNCFMYMKPDEANTDTTDEFNRIKELELEEK